MRCQTRAARKLQAGAGPRGVTFACVAIDQLSKRMSASRFQNAALYQHEMCMKLPRNHRDIIAPFDRFCQLARFISDISYTIQEQGELHFITDDSRAAEEICAALAGSKLFAPCLAFPFFDTGVPGSYPSGDVLVTDIAETREGGHDARRATLFYSRWEKRAPKLPNFRFQQGKGDFDRLCWRPSKRNEVGVRQLG